MWPLIVGSVWLLGVRGGHGTADSDQRQTLPFCTKSFHVIMSWLYINKALHIHKSTFYHTEAKLGAGDILELIC